ncbi:MAG: hypothetical protein IT566_14920 [Rhodospirillaceae bacterium]|nr:hypothetical protein [Rhodospirillaceae bacterium]
MTRHTLRLVYAAVAALMLASCAQGPNDRFPRFRSDISIVPPGSPPAVIRQPVVPEMLVPCRGHVLVPALGMTFVSKGQQAPGAGQYMREENLTPPYRILPPGVLVTKEHNPGRVNVELDAQKRIIGLYCG